MDFCQILTLEGPVHETTAFIVRLKTTLTIFAGKKAQWFCRPMCQTRGQFRENDTVDNGSKYSPHSYFQKLSLKNKLASI